MVTVPSDLRQRLREHGQEHVLAGWDDLDDSRRRGLLDQLRALDLDLLRRLYAQREKGFALPSADRIRPIPVARLDPADRATRELGEAALRRGEVAVLLVA